MAWRMGGQRRCTDRQVPSQSKNCCRSTNTGEAVAFASEKGLDPIHNGSHACGTPQVAVDDEPILAGGFGYWRGNTFEQRVIVRNKTRKNPASRPGADRREMHRHVGGTERH